MLIKRHISDYRSVCHPIFVPRIVCYMLFEAKRASCLTDLLKKLDLVPNNLQIRLLDLIQVHFSSGEVLKKFAKLSIWRLTGKISGIDMAAVPFSLHTAQKMRRNMELQVQQTTMQNAGLGENGSTPGGKSEYKQYKDDFFFPSGPGVNITDNYVDHLPAQYNSKLMNSIWGQYNRYSVHNFKKNTEGAASSMQTSGVCQGTSGLDRTPLVNREVQLPATIVGLWKDVVQSLGNKKQAH